MIDYIMPDSTIAKTDDQSITLAVKKAKETGINKVVIPKYNQRTGQNLWIIENCIRLPDDIEIIIDDAHLRLADGVYCNMFCNENLGTDKGRTPKGKQKNITIRGRGAATLDGGKYNGLSERNSEKDNLPHISVNTTLFFANVTGLTVENLNIINQRWWAITNVFVSNAVFRNIRFKADLSRIDADGIHHPNELPQNYGEIYVKNADGIDLRVGCHDVLIENITGFTEDDTVALTALGTFESRLGYAVDGGDFDIHDVKIRHVASDPFYCSVVRLLNDNGFKLYNVDIDGVTHLHLTDSVMQTHAAVKIGDMAYAKKHSELGDTHHISVRNVVSSAKYAVALCKGLSDSVIENIFVAPGGIYGVGASENNFAELERCRIENISAYSDSVELMPADRLTVVRQ